MKKKIFLLLALALGVALYIPESRARIWEVVKPVTYPFLGWITQGELDRIATDLVDYEDKYFKFPEAREFDEWMDERYADPNLTRDAWNTPYRLRAGSRTTYYVISAGPDQEFGTDDDLQARLVLPATRRR